MENEINSVVSTKNMTISVKAMRTIPQCIDLIKQMDINTCISRTYIESLCEKNKIRFLKSGSTKYIDFNCLIDYINNTNEGVV